MAKVMGIGRGSIVTLTTSSMFLGLTEQSTHRVRTVRFEAPKRE